MSENKPPRLPSYLLIGEDVPLVAFVSSVLAKKGHYLPVTDFPRLHRPDADNEIVKRQNIAVPYQPRNILFLKPPEGMREKFDGLPDKRVSIFENIDIFKQSGLYTDKSTHEVMEWGKSNIGVGLALALYQGKEIHIVANGPTAVRTDLKKDHLIVCEAGNDLSQLIAANYAFSLNADLEVIAEVHNDVADDILERLYNSQESRDSSPTLVQEGLAQELRSLSGNLDLSNRRMVTFITDHLPWGFAYPEVPSTHLFSYPELGLSILNAIHAEQAGPDANVALMVDPEQVAAAEVTQLASKFGKRGILTRVIRGRGANVHHVSKAIRLLPYDFLMISSHCGDVSGWRWTYGVEDDEGKNREVVTEVAISMSYTPTDKDNVEVLQYERFVSLDGVEWSKVPKENNIIKSNFIKNFMDRTHDPIEGLQPTHKESIPLVRGSTAIKLFDHNLMFMFEVVASGRLPIVFNNACVSWHNISKHLILGGARAYIGTLFSVSDTEAEAIALKLFDRHMDKSLAVGLWRTQQEVYGKSSRRPYILTGPHFQRLRFKLGNAPRALLGRLVQAHACSLKAEKKTTLSAFQLKKHAESTEYLAEEIKDVKEHFDL